MFFISFGKNAPRPRKKRVIKIEKMTPEKMKEYAGMELDMLAQRAMGKKGMAEVLRKTSELGMELIDVNVKNIKALKPPQRKTYKQWVENRLKWFNALREEARTTMNPYVQEKLMAEISKLEKIREQL